MVPLPAAKIVVGSELGAAVFVLKAVATAG